jgi:hypothetical protein
MKNCGKLCVDMSEQHIKHLLIWYIHNNLSYASQAAVLELYM